MNGLAEQIECAIGELDGLEAEVEPYFAPAVVMLRAELRALHRRLGNARRVICGPPSGSGGD